MGVWSTSRRIDARQPKMWSRPRGVRGLSASCAPTSTPLFSSTYKSWPRLPRQHQHLLQSTLPHSPCSSARSRRSSHLLAPSECRTGPLPSKVRSPLSPPTRVFSSGFLCSLSPTPSASLLPFGPPPDPNPSLRILALEPLWRPSTPFPPSPSSDPRARVRVRRPGQLVHPR